MMTLAKIIFIYTVIVVFVGVSIVGILAACGVIHISDTATACALIGPSLGIVATVIQAKHMFDDPDAIKKLKDEHSDLTRDARSLHAQEIMEIHKSHVQAMHENDVAHANEIAQLAQIHAQARQQDAEMIKTNQATILSMRTQNDELRARLPPKPGPKPPSGQIGNA